MPIDIANVELSYSFNQWRITTNQIIDALKENVVLKEDYLEGNFLDSIEVAATPITGSPIDTVTLTDTSKIVNFTAGQKVRIYGARATTTSAAVIPTPDFSKFSVTKNGFTGVSSGNAFNYKIVQFDYATGKISNSSGIKSVSSVNPLLFNDVNNIKIQFERSNTNYGVLIYRNISGVTGTTYHLIAVLGPKELSGISNQWIDYYNYDYVLWGKKNNRNEFDSSSGLIHFSLTAPTSAKLGWADAEIEFVDTSLARLRFKNDYYFESSCIIAHDDTSLIQGLIDERNSIGAKSVNLGPKVYFVRGLTIPNNFAIIGSGTKTTLRKLSWSSGSTTGNKIITSGSVINDFNLSNIVIDGNMQNQYLNSETADPYNNYIVDILGNTFRYENTKVVNTIGGGVNASDSTSVSVVSCFFQDGNLTDRYNYSPLNVSSSSDVVLSSNIFKNFSGAVEASVITTGSIVGNIVKNCGSGLVVYGSTNLVSSPNILMGPANEFLPTPDILNSTYDSVNINLEANTNYNSDMYTYQENGEVIDLTANRSTLYHRVDKLQKIDSAESLYGNEVLIANNPPLQPVVGTNLANGEFKFTISAQNVNILLNDYSYSKLKANNTNHVGLVYRSVLTEYVPSGNVFNITPTINNISRSITSNTNGVNNTTNTLKITNANTYFNVGDPVYYNIPSTNTAIGGLTANTVYYVSFANSTDVALSATYNGSNVDLNETRTTNPAPANNFLNKTLYTIKLSNASNISVGTRVRLLNHGGTPNLNDQVGTIVNYDTITEFCNIVYSPTINISSPGSQGSITIENSFVLAKGRIL